MLKKVRKRTQYVRRPYEQQNVAVFYTGRK